MTKLEVPASWYPVCLSREIRRRKIKPLRLFGQDWILFRGASGRPGIIKRHCLHMGTDLAGGRVVGDEVQCPFHLWRYSTEGICQTTGVKTAAMGEKRLEVVEREGLIFAFAGAKPSFAFPRYSRCENSKAGAVMTKTLKTPHQSLIFNGFDSYHLERIHNRLITAPVEFSSAQTEHLRADFSMKVIKRRFYDFVVAVLGSDEQNFYIDCWGGNTVIITNARTNDNIIITSVPIEENLSRIFIYAVTERGATSLKRLGQWLRLTITAYLGEKFLDPDVRIVENMRPLERHLVPEVDWPVEKFWQYWENLPRI